MNREWVLGARSVISSDSIIHGCKTSCNLNDLDGSEGDVLWKVVLGDLRSGSGDDKDTNVKEACEEDEYHCFMDSM